MTAEQVDVAVVGGGPAGLAAALSARDAGARVRLIDRRLRPQQQIRAGLISPELETWLGHRFGLDSTRLGDQGPYRGLRLHIKGLPSFPAASARPGRFVDRGELLSGLREALGDDLIAGTVCSLTTRGERSILGLQRGGEAQELAARVVIDATGQRADALRRGAAVELWHGESRSPALFEAEVFMEAERVEPGWLHLFVTSELCAVVQAAGGGLAVRALAPSDRRWGERWQTLVQTLDLSLGAGLRRERCADFHWVARRDDIDLGSDRQLLVGQAAGLSTMLGYGLEVALRSGEAAGAAAATGRGAETVRAQLEDALRDFASEGTLAGLRRGSVRLDPLGTTLEDAIAGLGRWRRWRMRRRVSGLLQKTLRPPRLRRVQP